MPDRAETLRQPERLAAIAASELLDSGAIPALDRVVRSAARLLDVPVAQLNVVTSDRQIPVSHSGGDAWGRSVDLDHSFCQHAIHSGEPLVVANAREHPLVSSSPPAREGEIVAYLSIPIRSPRARSPLATLCVVDFVPRDWTERDIATLGDLAAWALSEIELRAERYRERRRAEEALRNSEAQLRAVYDGTYEYIGLISPDGTVLDANRASLEFAGNRREDVVGKPLWNTPWFIHTPGASEQVREGVARAAAGEFVRYEATLRRPDGGALTFDFSLHPVRNDAGKVAFIVPEGRDVTERHRVEAARRETEERYRLLFESLDEGFCIIEVLFDESGSPCDYRFIEANPAFVQQTGLTGVVGRRVKEMVPTHEPHWFDRYGRVARTGEAQRFEDAARGLNRWYDVFAFPAGPIGSNRVAVLFRDVTSDRLAAAERERLLAALAVERARLVEVIRRAPAFMVVLRGPDLLVELANDAYRDLVGARPTVGRPLFDLIPEARNQGFEELLQGVLESGEAFTGHAMPIRLQRSPEGPLEERLMDLAYVPLTEADGSISGIVVLGTDVTDQHRARQETEQARDRAERLQALTAALAGARTVEEVADVVVADMVIALGARTGALANRSPERQEMVLLRTIGFPDPLPDSVRHQRLEMVSPLTECYRTQAPVWIERRDGPEGLDARYPPISPIWDRLEVQSAAFVPLVTAGETIGVISFGFEAPRQFSPEERAFLLALGQQAALAVERARLFDAERDARAEAEKANMAKSEFLAIMSHELRTPLNAIGGYTELMEMGIRGPLTPEQTRDLARIRQSQRHLLGLINEVLNYARLETGSVHFHLSEVWMHEVIAGAEALVAPQAHARSLQLVVPPVKDDLVAMGDPEKVRQILVNLLSNSIKFTDSGGLVEVTCRGSDAFVEVDVRDTGLGIASEQMERIFEPFVQVRSDLTRVAEGTGLGLAISRDLARGMGGELMAESEPGVGSTFTLRLPMAHDVSTPD